MRVSSYFLVLRVSKMSTQTSKTARFGWWWEKDPKTRRRSLSIRERARFSFSSWDYYYRMQKFLYKTCICISEIWITEWCHEAGLGIVKIVLRKWFFKFQMLEIFTILIQFYNVSWDIVQMHSHIIRNDGNSAPTKTIKNLSTYYIHSQFWISEFLKDCVENLKFFTIGAPDILIVVVHIMKESFQRENINPYSKFRTLRLPFEIFWLSTLKYLLRAPWNYISSSSMSFNASLKRLSWWPKMH